MTRRYAIVGCGKAKKDESAPAKELYTSTFFEKKREFAEVFARRWWILSAEHGLVEPDTVLEPYDTTVEDLDDRERYELRRDVRDTFKRTFDGVVNARVDVLAGRDYVDLVAPVLDAEEFLDRGILAKYPLQGFGGIGEQMQHLNRKVKQELDT